MLKEKPREDLLISIPKTNISQSLDMQIILHLKDSSCISQQVIERNMGPIKELTVETMVRIVKINLRK